MKGFYRRPKVLELTGYSTASLYRKMRRGEFPQAYALGQGTRAAVGWKVEDIEAWLNARTPAGSQKVA